MKFILEVVPDLEEPRGTQDGRKRVLLQVASQPMSSLSWTKQHGGSWSHSPAHTRPIRISVGCAFGRTDSMESRGGAWADSSQQTPIPSESTQSFLQDRGGQCHLSPWAAGRVRRKMWQFILHACSDLDVLAKKKKKKNTPTSTNPSYEHRLNFK